jgi:indole-3-glycerol phosphate synthase
MSVLTEIVSRKRERLKAAKETNDLGRVRELALEKRSSAAAHRLVHGLHTDGVNIIAEFKRKSPSKGIIRADVEAKSMAQRYEAGGAVAISVLTEEDYFDGSLDDLREVRTAVQLPILRKDFLLDEYQIYEAAAYGADAILLIVAVLDDQSLSGMREVAEDKLGMDALVEIHDEHEMERAVATGAKLIGVNNRNLHTFEVSLRTSLELVAKAPTGATLISESGLHKADDLLMLRKAGYHGFLIGESLMRAHDPAEALRVFLDGAELKN